MPAAPEQVLAQLLSVSGADGYKPLMHSPEGVTLHRKRFPTWAVVFAVLTFPIGLLFLLAREDETVGIALQPVQGGTQVTISGQASRALQSSLQYVLSGYAATPAGLPQGVVAVPGPPPPPAAPPPPPPPPPSA